MQAGIELGASPYSALCVVRLLNIGKDYYSHGPNKIGEAVASGVP